MQVKKSASEQPHQKAATQKIELKSKHAENNKTQMPSKPTMLAKSAAAAKTASPASAPKSIVSLITASGLPADKLSASIISFARFFSLPIKPELMADIRRQAFALQATAQQAAAQQAEAQESTQQNDMTKQAAILKTRETFSLAAAACSAAAAESKGVELTQKGFEMFREAIDPDERQNDADERQNTDGQQDKHQNTDNNKHKKEKQQDKADEALEIDPVTASSIKKTALEAAEKNLFLNIFNKLPGKDGKHWIVIPFYFFDNENEYRVSMRILLEPEKTANSAICMAMDISAIGEKQNRFSFVFESANNKISRLSAYFQDELSIKKSSIFQNELSRLLDIPADRVSVKFLQESFPCESGRGESLFQFVDEAV